jgi:hypothetical protein
MYWKDYGHLRVKNFDGKNVRYEAAACRSLRWIVNTTKCVKEVCYPHELSTDSVKLGLHSYSYLIFGFCVEKILF